MTQVVTPSKTITKGQAGKFADVLINALCKSNLPSEPTQQVIETHGAALAAEFVALVQKRVETNSDLLMPHVKIDRSRTQQAMIDATDRAKYLDGSVVKMIPKGEGAEADVYFFKVGRYLPVADLAKEYELRGLVPDHYAQAAVNEADPAFADE